MAEPSWELRSFIANRYRGWFIVVPLELGPPIPEGQVFDTEVMRVSGEAALEAFIPHPSHIAPPRFVPTNDDLVSVVHDQERFTFPRPDGPNDATPRIERFTITVTRRLITRPANQATTTPDIPVKALADDFHALEIARFGHPLPSLGRSHPPQQASNQIEIGYRLPETSRQGARATSGRAPQDHRGESSSATPTRQPSGPRPPPPSFTGDTPNAAAAAAAPGGTSSQTALSPSGSSTPRSPSLRGGSITSDSDGDSDRGEGGP